MSKRTLIEENKCFSFLFFSLGKLQEVLELNKSDFAQLGFFSFLDKLKYSFFDTLKVHFIHHHLDNKTDHLTITLPIGSVKDLITV